MLLLLEGFVLASLPVVFVFALLVLAARRDRRRAEAVTRQIAVTEAIHRRLGAIVAPTVEPRAWGPWRLRIPVPFERPDVVATVLDVAHRAERAFDDGGRRDPGIARSRPMEIVLTPQEEHRACA